jgi:uncharacterized membrane protein
MIKKLFSREHLHAYFNAGIWIKGIDSIGEITIGLLLYFDPQLITRFIFALFGDELTESPRDGLLYFFFHNWNGFSGGSQYLFAFLFLGHGLTKIFLVTGLVKNKIWVYPIAAFAFFFFAVYQIYEITSSPNLLLGIYSLLDILFVGLIINEYCYKLRALKNPA